MINLYLFNEGSRAATYGIGTYIREMTNSLSCREDVSLNIIQLVSDRKDFEIEKNIKFNIYHFPKSAFYIDYKKSELYYRNIWYILRQHIKSSENERLVFHLNFAQEYPLIFLMKRDFPKCHTILTIHYQQWCFTLNGSYSRFKKIISQDKEKLTLIEEETVYESYEKEKILYLSIDTIICLGNYAKDILMKDYNIPKEKIKVINHGISDEAVLLSSTKQKKMRQKLFIPEDEIVMVFVGRIDDMKGIDVLIEAFGSVVKDYPKCHLYIIGEGGNMNNYMNKAEYYWRKITFTGRLKKEDVYKFYQVANIGILPSRYESFGYVAIEMMMFNIPIIATKTSGLNEILTGEVDGYKIPIKEKDDKVIILSEDIKDCVIKKIMSKCKRKTKSRNTFLEKYTTKKMIELYIPLLYCEGIKQSAPKEIDLIKIRKV